MFWAQDIRKLELVREYKDSLAPFDIGSLSDILVTDQAIYLAVHQATSQRGHSILVFDKNGRFLHKIGQRLGRGPDELEAPQEIAIWKDEIMVNDLIGISFYKIDGKFLGRFNPFTLEISCAFVDGRFYMAAANPNTASLFEAFTRDGKFLFEFGHKFKDIDQSILQERSVYAIYFPFKGKLLTDGSMLFFLNSTFGQVLTFGVDGTPTASFDISLHFGNAGTEAKEANDRWWVKGEHGKDGLQVREMFMDADLCGDRIYLLFQPEITVDEYMKGRRAGLETLALDKKDLTVVDRYAVPLISRILAVEDLDGEPQFYFYDGGDREANRICVYRPKK